MRPSSRSQSAATTALTAGIGELFRVKRLREIPHWWGGGSGRPSRPRELSDTSQLPTDIDLGPAALQAPSGCTDARLLLSSGPRSMPFGSCAARSCRLRERLLDPPRGPGNGLEPRWRCSAGLLAPYRTHSRQPRAPAPSCELLASSVRDAASLGHTRISSVTSSALAACAPGSAPLSSSRRRVGTAPSLEARGRRRSSRRRSLEAPGRRDWGSLRRTTVPNGRLRRPRLGLWIRAAVSQLCRL